MAERDEVKEVQSRITRAQSFVKEWHTNIDRWRDMYNMRHYPKKGKPNEIRYNDPTYTNTVDLTVGIMLGNDLQWHAYGFSVSKEEQDNTGKLEKLIQGALEINDEREEAHQIYRLFHNFSRDGGGVIYSVFDPQLALSAQTVVDKQLPDGTIQQKIKFLTIPLVVQMVDPKKIFCLPGGKKRWLMIGREEDRSVLDVEATYNVTIDTHHHKDQEQKAASMGKFQDVWDYVLVGNQMLVRNTILFENRPIVGPRIMDGYDDLPYSVQFYKPVGEESELWQSSISPLESSVAMLERSFNRRAHQIDVYTSLPLIIKSQPGRPVKIDPGLYNSLTISPDEGIEFPQWPGNSPDVNMQMEFLRSRIQQSGFSDVMFGSGQSQVAGYALSQLGDQNRIRLEQPIKHLELLLTTWAKKSIKLLTNFASGTVICVYGRQRGEDYIEDIDVDEITGYSIRAEIRPNFPNEQMRKTAMSTQVKGTLSERTIMERYLDIEQPEDEEQRKIIEMTTKHPASIQYAIMAELKRRAEDEDNPDEIAAMVLQSMMNNGMPGQAGRPADPRNPEQLTGTQSPTGQPVRQATGGEPAGQSAVEQQNNIAQNPSMTGE